MRRWWLPFALLLSLGTNLGVLATLAVDRRRDEPRPPRAELRPPANLPAVAERLGLEGERREQFLAIQRRFFVATREHRLRLEELRRELRREVMRDGDRGRIDALLAEIGAAYVALDRALVENVMASRRLLDPEQERRFMQLLGALRQRRPGDPPLRGAPGPWRRRAGERFGDEAPAVEPRDAEPPEP